MKILSSIWEHLLEFLKVILFDRGIKLVFIVFSLFSVLTFQAADFYWQEICLTVFKSVLEASFSDGCFSSYIKASFVFCVKRKVKRSLYQFGSWCVFLGNQRPVSLAGFSLEWKDDSGSPAWIVGTCVQTGFSLVCTEGDKARGDPVSPAKRGSALPERISLFP